MTEKDKKKLMTELAKRVDYLFEFSTKVELVKEKIKFSKIHKLARPPAIKNLAQTLQNSRSTSELKTLDRKNLHSASVHTFNKKMTKKVSKNNILKPKASFQHFPNIKKDKSVSGFQKKKGMVSVASFHGNQQKKQGKMEILKKRIDKWKGMKKKLIIELNNSKKLSQSLKDNYSIIAGAHFNQIVQKSNFQNQKNLKEVSIQQSLREIRLDKQREMYEINNLLAKFIKNSNSTKKVTRLSRCLTSDDINREKSSFETFVDKTLEEKIRKLDEFQNKMKKLVE